MICQLYLLYLCIYSSHVITPIVNSSMYSCVTHRQVKRMVTLNLFIESPLQIHCIRYQSEGTSLLITCPQLTEESSPLLAAAAIPWLLLWLMLCNSAR